MTRAIRARRSRRGTAAVEMAIVMSFILPPLLLGTWEVGRMINVKETLSNAAREGARQASAGQLTNAQVQQVVLNYLTNAGVPTTNAVVTVSDLTNPGTDATQATQLDQLQVGVTLPYSDVEWVGLHLITTSTTQLNAQAIFYSTKDQNYPTSVTAPAGY
jgi:Flp pilus assembly protein TadG